MSPELRDYYAELMKAIANPVRLHVLCELKSGAKTASDLVKRCKVSKANLSQHINLLKQEGLVLCDKRGTFCHYTLADARIFRALDLLQEVLYERMSHAPRPPRKRPNADDHVL